MSPLRLKRANARKPSTGRPARSAPGARGPRLECLVILAILAALGSHSGLPGPTSRAPLAAAETPSTAPPPSIVAPPFAMPGAEELAKVRWVKRQSIDFFAELRAARAPEPSVAAEEAALSTINRDPVSNERILRALGRLPRDDEEVDWDGRLMRQIQAEPGTMNPLFASTRYDFWIEDLLFASPLHFDWNLQAFGDLDIIESWETSEDGLLDRIVLRGDLVWDDGRRVTARDIESSFRLMTDPKIRVPARSALVEGLRAVRAVDDRTVIYFQKESIATNYLNLMWAILPAHVYEAALSEDPTLQRARLNREPVGCGRYRLLRWNAGQELVFERRDAWWKGSGENGARPRQRPYFREVVFRVLPENATRYLSFLAGEIDESQIDSVQWTVDTEAPAFRAKGIKVRGDEWAYAFIAWNAKSVPPNPFFADPRVRRAMTLAFDHEHLLRDVLQGIYRSGEGIFHPDSWMAAKDLKPYRRDIDEAERLLDEAGWTDRDGDGTREKTIDGRTVPFRFTLSCPAGGTGPKVAQLLWMNLREIGVDCEVKLVEWVAFNKDIAERRAQAFLMTMGTGLDPDLSSNQWSTKAQTTGRNFIGYSNPTVDALFEAGRREFAREKRALIYAEIDRRIYADDPITVLLYQPSLWCFSKSLRGFGPSPKGFYGYLPGFHSLWRKKEAKP